MPKTLKKIQKIVRHHLAKPFRPKERLIKQVQYQGATFAVFANEDVGWRIIAEKDYEDQDIECFLGLVREDDICVDIGGNIGIYTVLMSSRARKGQILTFEPVAINRSLLSLNIELNNITNAKVYDLALSNSTSPIQFSVSEDAAYSSIRPTGRKEEATSVTVPSDTLDNLFASKGRGVNIMKIDVEGAELLVLQGGAQLLADRNLRPRAILVEVNPVNQTPYGYTPEDVLRFMEQFDYQPFSITDDGVKRGWPHGRASEDVLFLTKDQQESLVAN